MGDFLIGSAVTETQENVLLVPHVSIFLRGVSTLILYFSSWKGEMVHRSHICLGLHPFLSVSSLSSILLGLKFIFSYQSISEKNPKI